MVRIRFRRVGARNQASFRIVAADRESPRDGRFLEVLGSYNPRTEPSTIQVDEARLFHWMKHGAQPSDAVVQTLRGIGTWDRWERFKQGEPIEKLVEEGLAAIPEVDPRTRRDDLIGKPSKKKRSAAKTKEAAEPAAMAPESEEQAVETPEDEPAEPAEVEQGAVDEAAEAEAGAEAEVEAQAEAAEAEMEAEAKAEAEEPAAEAEESAAEEPAADADEAAAAEAEEPEASES